MITLARHCRISGEPLENADVLFGLEASPFPGVYPATAEASQNLRTPLQVVQSRGSGFVQLAHAYDASLYQQYAFSGGVGAAYRQHLTWFADQIAATFAKDARILEVGCGDGWLVRRLREIGFTQVYGIDPSQAARANETEGITCGYFPDDLPAELRATKFDLVVTRHVLEHIETPRPFVTALREATSTAGQLWIEVPDLTETIRRGLWSNFYQLHCGYYCAETLDTLLGGAGMRCIGGTIVEVFGGSLLRRYIHGYARPTTSPARCIEISARVAAFQQQLAALAERLPGGAVGYGAAERTAVTLGHAPLLASRLTRLYDGNPLLAGRYLAGTSLPILPKEELFAQAPGVVLLFAISNASEILAEWKRRLPPETLVAIVGGDFSLKPLRER